MRLTDFKVLSFGCYGTLIDRDAGVWTALKRLLAGDRIKLSRREVLAAFDRHQRRIEAASPELTYRELLAQAHSGLAKEWGVLCADAEHELFGSSVPQWPPFALVPAALQYLKRYFRIAVLTNGDRESLASSVRRLEARFDWVYTAEEIGSFKPDPRNFAFLLDRLGQLGYAPGELLHVAASVRRDLAPAARLGIATAWITRHADDADADKVDRTGGAPFSPHFSSLADSIKAHQEELRA